MKLWNHYELENLSQDPKKFISFLVEFMKNHSVEDTLEVIRISGICFNIYNKGQKEISKKVISNVKSFYKNDIVKIEEFVKAIGSINSIFEDFYILRSSKGLNQIPKEKEVISFILSLEILLGSIIEYINGHSLDRIKQVYPYVFSLFDGGKQHLIRAEKDMDRVLGIADSIAESAGSLLKFMGGAKGDLGDLETMSLDHVKIAREHIELFDLWSTLLNLEQKWRFIGAKFNIHKRKINIQPNDENILKAQEISKVRFISQRVKWFADFNLSDKTKLKNRINPNTKSLPPKYYLCEDEAYYCIAISEFLHTYDLDIKCLGVSLAEWIRAYIIIKLEAKKNLKDRFASKAMKSLNLGNWTIVKKDSEWINLFVEKGISHSSAVKIMKSFKFTSSSKDLLDCPFVVHNDSLIVIPSVASHIDPSISLISLLTKRNVDISFKGTGLEEEILETLNKQNIYAKRLKQVHNSDTYECDAVFTLNNDLFFVELKAYGQPHTIKEYYNFLLKTNGEAENINSKEMERSATEQLNRIVDFYMSNINIVKKELELEDNWMPNNIYKIIITTAKLGEIMYHNDCYIIDTSAFVSFLKRVPPGFRIGKKFFKPYHEDFEGDITSAKLVNVLKNTPQIELGNIRVGKNYRNIILNGLTLEYPYFNDHLGDFIKYDKELLQKLGLNMDEISVSKESKSN
ncbi:hypothetical protein [Lysinibacillus xylanilyticus]|uniref:hypothetical protein n=1 Tax=Lysinibacillus xylanilyticus TaxID=582475 RepID=UPI00381DF514